MIQREAPSVRRPTSRPYQPRLHNAFEQTIHAMRAHRLSRSHRFRLLDSPDSHSVSHNITRSAKELPVSASSSLPLPPAQSTPFFFSTPSMNVSLPSRNRRDSLNCMSCFWPHTNKPVQREATPQPRTSHTTRTMHGKGIRCGGSVPYCQRQKFLPKTWTFIFCSLAPGRPGTDGLHRAAWRLADIAT